MQHSLPRPLQSLRRAPLALVLRCRQKWNCRPSSLVISGKEAGLGAGSGAAEEVGGCLARVA